jgi:hypothetical protein
MDEFLDGMRVGRDSFRVPLKEFLDNCDPFEEKDQLFCFVEAIEDKVFYNSKIRGKLGKRSYSITCRNRKNVISVHDELSTRAQYRQVKIGYFIDRDFSEHLPPDETLDGANIYVTPVHSIENFYVQPPTITAVFDEIFNLSFNTADHRKAMRFFDDLFSLFHQRTLPLNAFICCQAVTYSNAEPAALNIDGKTEGLFKTVVSVDLDTVDNFSAIDGKEKLEGLFQAGGIPDELWEEKIRYFQQADSSRVNRGKFEAAFLFSFLTRLKDSLLKGTRSGWEKVHKPNVQLRKEDLLEILVDKVTAPDCLMAYIEALR